MKKLQIGTFQKTEKKFLAASACKYDIFFFVAVLTDEPLPEPNEKFSFATTKTFRLSSLLKFQVLNCNVAKPFTFLVYKRLQILPLRQGRSNFKEC